MTSENNVPAGEGVQQCQNTTLPDGELTFEVVLRKPYGARLGIDVMTQAVTEFSGLTVKRISKGCVVDDWNRTCLECYKVQPGDCIIMVNGVTSDFAHMWEELRTRADKDLHMTILRHTGQQPSLTKAPGPVTLPAHVGRNPRRPALADSAADAASTSLHNLGLDGSSRSE